MDVTIFDCLLKHRWIGCCVSELTRILQIFFECTRNFDVLKAGMTLCIQLLQEAHFTQFLVAGQVIRCVQWHSCNLFLFFSFSAWYFVTVVKHELKHLGPRMMRISSQIRTNRCPSYPNRKNTASGVSILCTEQLMTVKPWGTSKNTSILAVATENYGI